MSEHEVANRKQAEEQPALSGRGLSTNRVEALADGIFAVAMTLLVLDVHPPTVRQPPDVWFFSEWPRLFAYALSFMLLGVYWVSHHAHFQYIKRSNRTLLWVNIVFFLFISLIPFSTSWLADSVDLEYTRPIPAGTTALIFYGLHLIVIAALIALHWWYGSTNPLLIGGKAPDRHFNLSVYRRIAISPVICLVAIAFSFILPIASLICYTLIPIVYIFPGHVDLHWTRANHH
ncbi:hypothetical protein KSF_024070 [Reticulibacter mediterranei]|uniref:DUF1211 domain-containing protein n=1 Tax=Reticulibacter mediterranei TaxID=2778369 RepID=A0A8J3IJ46_9CHLR|nr:TMEM175 family protein [Reticulibacter mediterranei]GHO92359.1 hypothetical protein KSF_024070 [Reticulibacter mediterranei]